MSAEIEVEVEVDAQVEIEAEVGIDVEVEVEVPEIEVEVEAPEIEIEVECPEVEVQMEVEVECPGFEVEMGGDLDVDVELGGGIEIEIDGGELGSGICLGEPLVEVEVAGGVDYEVEYEVDEGKGCCSKLSMGDSESGSSSCFSAMGLVFCSLMLTSSIALLFYWIWLCFPAETPFKGEASVKFGVMGGAAGILLLSLAALGCTRCFGKCRKD